jgi:F0F1-type ATP synthase assembly protein I
MTPEPQPGPKKTNPWHQVGVAMGLIFTIPVGVAVGALLGLWLDEKAGTSPLFTLLLIAAGFAGALREVLRQLKKIK